MIIPLEFYEFLRNRINISDVVRQKVTLTRRASEYVGLCPFHQEKSPSFTVNDNKRFYHCFGCGAHGDVIKFIASTNGLSYKESAIKLAQDHGIELPKITREQENFYEESDKILHTLELATEFFKSQINAEVLSYLTGRDISLETINKFDIGFAPRGGKLQKFFTEKSLPSIDLVKAGLLGTKDDGQLYEIFHDRLIFPIRNIYNKVIGFGGRVINNSLPKYLNSPETAIFKKGETLYGENKAISAAFKKNYSILVEGYLDVIALSKEGFEEAAASLGTAVTQEHIQKLWRAGNEIIICLDGDAAGVRASNKVIHLVLPLITNDKKISFILLPTGEDPDDIIRKRGRDFFSQLIDNRISLSAMIWQIEYAGKVFNTAEARASLEATLSSYCERIKDRLLSNSYSRFFKEQIWEKILRNSKKEFNKIKTTSATRISSPNLNTNNYYSEIEILEYAILSLMVRFPEIIEKPEVKDFLLDINLKTVELVDFRDWFFSAINSAGKIDMENITATAEKTRFYNTLLLLLQPDNFFLNTEISKKNINQFLLWELLHKKYYLALLKQEYTAIMQSTTDEAFKKAVLYREEILKTSAELLKLNESIY